MDVLILGGSGFIGSNLAEVLNKRDHNVTILSRNPEKADISNNIDTVSGDVTDYESIEESFQDKDVAVNLVALSPLFIPKGGNKMHEKIHVEGTRNIVVASQEHNIQKLIQMSALGADPSGDTAYIRAKGEAEQIIHGSDIDFTIFRPSIVFGKGDEFVKFTKKLTTPYITGLPSGGKTKFQPIWVGDLTPTIADSIEQEKHTGKTYEIGGPEILTLAQVAKQIYKSEGKTLTIIPIPMFLAGIGLKIGEKIPGFPMGADQYRSLKFDNTVKENDIKKFGLKEKNLKKFSEYLKNKK